MVDAVGSMAKIKLQIKQAVDTVRQHEEDCVQIGKHVTILSAIVSKLENSGTVRDPAMKALHETLNQAYELIKNCQGETVCLMNFLQCREMSKQLCQVNNNILAQMAVANFGNNVQNTIMFTTHFHLALAKDPEQAGLFQEDKEEDGVSNRQHDASYASLKRTMKRSGSELLKRFKYGLRPCCKSSDPDGFCGEWGKDEHDGLFTVCKDPSKHFYWDDVHPTQAGWEAVMEQLEVEIKEFLDLN